MTPTLTSIRATLAAMGNHSHTTEKFQSDLMDYARAYSKEGDCLIEVGCFRGGLTAQFAAIGKELGQHLHVVDIDPGYLEVARQSVQSTTGDDNVSFHLCDLATFAQGAGKGIRVSLALIDGDHYYNGVVADVRALLAMVPRPYGVAFHDYSLRYAIPEGKDIRVDRAIHDTLGRDFPHVRIGEISRIGGPLRHEPREDGHFHEVGVSEGVLVEFRKLSIE
jgi:SAM-dependent methyltransferase